MKYFAISAVLLMSTLTAQVSRADDFEPFGYLTVGASRSAAVFDGTLDDAFDNFAGPGIPASSHIGDTWGANAHAGYRFHKFLAAEVEYEWMKDFNLRIDGVGIGSLQTQVITANLKVVAPFGAFEPYFLAGAGAMLTTQDKDIALDWDVGSGQFTMKFGAGMDYWLTKNMSLSLGAEVVTNSVKVSFAGNPGGDGEGISYVAGQFGFGFRF